jgi:phage/plasmid-associated DNA primase
VYDRYEEWCEEGGEKPETRRKFNARLKERGQFTDRRSGPGGSYEWHGLQLLKKENVRFAGKLKEHSQNDYNGLVSSSRSVDSTNNFSSSVTSVEPTEEQTRKIAKLVHGGTAENAARATVLGDLDGWLDS